MDRTSVEVRHERCWLETDRWTHGGERSSGSTKAALSLGGVEFAQSTSLSVSTVKSRCELNLRPLEFQAMLGD